MNDQQVLKLNGVLKLRAIFSCGKCRAQAAGETEDVEIAVTTVSELHSRLENYTPRRFPVGWASFGIGEYACQNCFVSGAP
jgi:hypothetical protein